MTGISDMRARAFGEGSDARIEGRRLADNPYRGLGDPHLTESWEQGWWDVDQNFGKGARTPRRLRLVGEAG